MDSYSTNIYIYICYRRVLFFCEKNCYNLNFSFGLNKSHRKPIRTKLSAMLEHISGNNSITILTCGCWCFLYWFFLYNKYNSLIVTSMNHDNLCVCLCVCVYTHIYRYTCIYIYTHAKVCEPLTESVKM